MCVKSEELAQRIDALEKRLSDLEEFCTSIDNLVSEVVLELSEAEEVG